jgi:hypothetical protein
MAKLLRIALAVWKTGKPFNPEHYSWDQPVHLQPQPEVHAQEPAPPTSPQAPEASQQAAGHKNPAMPERSVVTAACGLSSLPQEPAAGNSAARHPAAPRDGHASDIDMSQCPDTTTAKPKSATAVGRWLDFTHLKRQLPIQRVLEHLQLFSQLRGCGSQRRGPCPVHGQGQGRTFSVHLEENIFQCFDPKCAIKGDIIDLWAAVKSLKLRDAALELVTLFNLEHAPVTEKRHG